jgi:hypothetical protein
VKKKLPTELTTEKPEQNSGDSESSLNPKSAYDQTIRPRLRTAKLGNLPRYKSQMKTETAINEDRGD